MVACSSAADTSTNIEPIRRGFRARLLIAQRRLVLKLKESCLDKCGFTPIVKEGCGAKIKVIDYMSGTTCESLARLSLLDEIDRGHRGAASLADTSLNIFESVSHVVIDSLRRKWNFSS